MDFKILTEFPDSALLSAWRDFLSEAAYPTHYITPGFFTDPFIRGGKRFAVLAMDGEKINAILTAVDSGREVVSGFSVRPQTAFRKNIDQTDAAKVLIEGLLEHGGADLELVNFHTWEPVDGLERLGFRQERSTGESAVVMLDLSRGAETLFREFSQTRQNEIKKALKQNVLIVREVEIEAELKELYKIHCEWSRLKNIGADSFEDFTQIINDKENRKTLIAVYDGKVIAGTFFRFCVGGGGGVIEYAGNNSLTEHQKLRPNPLIGWRAIQWACDNSFTHFSMGASHEFLRRFGGAIHSSYRYALDRTFFKRHENKEKLKKLALRTYQSLPVSAREQIKRTLGR